jgi:peptide/nickel transport system substrate-binding protein
MQKRAYDLVFYIPLGTYFGYEAYRANVTGLPESPVMIAWGADKA